MMRNFQKLRKPVDRTDWGETPAIANAFYDASLNAMIFPAGILRSPYFSKDVPMFLNFAGIGSAVAHELTHGFDNEGRQFDKNGNFSTWWSKKDSINFNKKAKCVTDQYDNFTISADGKEWHVNGTLIQDEAIADIGAVRLALQSYLNWRAKNSVDESDLPGLSQYNWKQLWFLSMAQEWCGIERDENAVFSLMTSVHPPDKIRVNGPVSNSEEFAETYNCAVGSAMNPRRTKCVIW
ncbi:PREDICTED: neprilysin-11-like [Priapulus caudatus]|uniref:Neprilysin-11-like n=1 Tax=Priapulus caudatus TaxID=37621 RepID=A0ABM1E1E4_PRICU|nr:PREDICTED: neprilysin-11-like [Priapulus caudatus]